MWKRQQSKMILHAYIAETNQVFRQNTLPDAES